MNKNEWTKKIALISTRPHKTNIKLSVDLKNSSISLLDYPLTEIYPLDNYKIFDGILKNLKIYHHIIFISTNSVHFFLERVKKQSINIPKSLIFSCIGPTTKSLLQKNLSVNIHSPENHFDSEHLLKKEILSDVRERKILIIRGKGGRETLKNELEKRGADVSYGECYIRKYVNINLFHLKKDLTKYNHKFMLISSTNSAKHLINQLIDIEKCWLHNIKIIVNHNKIRDQLSAIFKHILVSENIELQKLKELIATETLD